RPLCLSIFGPIVADLWTSRTARNSPTRLPFAECRVCSPRGEAHSSVEPPAPMQNAPLCIALLLCSAACTVVGSYDFNGYQALNPGPDAAAAADLDATTRNGVPACLPLTCAELGAECGRVPDGCNSTLDCGTCAKGICGGGGRYKCGDD